MLAPASGTLPARSVKVVTTLMTFVASSRSSVGVKVPVQVTPPSPLLTAVSVPLAKVMSELSNAVTVSDKVMVNVEVSPTFKALSDMTTLDTSGSVVSIV